MVSLTRAAADMGFGGNSLSPKFPACLSDSAFESQTVFAWFARFNAAPLRSGPFGDLSLAKVHCR